MSAPRAAAAIAPGRLAVVTGAASGIGLAAARSLAARKMRVALVDRAGRFVWGCVPRVDGDPVFSALVGGEAKIGSSGASQSPAR